MSVVIKTTQDNSKTLYSNIYKEHYHNLGGALSESLHIYINLGLSNFNNKSINIFEIGYGTGLNAVLTYWENQRLNNTINYHAIDKHPIGKQTFLDLNFTDLIGLKEDLDEGFYDDWDKSIQIGKSFNLLKIKADLTEYNFNNKYDLVYYDAFSASSQPELWEFDIISKVCESIKKDGILVSYCCNGKFKENLRNCGMKLKRHQGPVGKRHVLSAKKL